MARILVVEDEMSIARTLRDYLEVAGYDVTVVGDGGAAIASARGERPDLVVLDLGLPSVDGLDVARELRRDSTVPIVMVTARGEETDRIVGLELGADDYLVKPFSPKELVARVRAVLRRTTGGGAAEVLRAGRRRGRPVRMRVRVAATRRRPHADRVPAARHARPRAGPRVHARAAPGRVHGAAVATVSTARSTRT